MSTRPTYNFVPKDFEDLYPEGLRIEAAAIIGYDGKVYSLPPPNRHCHIIRYMADVLKHPTPIKGEQGFILNDGNFVRRKPAKEIAILANQLLERASKSNSLFSEDVW